MAIQNNSVLLTVLCAFWGSPWPTALSIVVGKFGTSSTLPSPVHVHSCITQVTNGQTEEERGNFSVAGGRFPKFQYVGFSSLVAESMFSVNCPIRNKKEDKGTFLGLSKAVGDGALSLQKGHFLQDPMSTQRRGRGKCC